MRHLTPEVIGALALLFSLAIGFLAGWCIRPDDHTPEDDREQINYLIRCAERENARRIRLGKNSKRSLRNLFGLLS